MVLFRLFCAIRQAICASMGKIEKNKNICFGELEYTVETDFAGALFI